MYAIYTQPRPGRPRLAVLTAAGILLLTILMAEGIIHLKRVGQRVTLGEPILLPAGQLKCRMPAGWKVETENQPPGIVAEAAEPEGNRRLMIFRGLPRRMGVPSNSSLLAIAEILSQPLSRQLIQFAEGEPARIGPLPAWDYQILHNRVPSGQARVAVAADGSLFGILLLAPGGQSGGARLLNEISGGIEFTEIATVDGKEAMDSAGIHFSAPGDATFFRNSMPQAARVRMLGGQAEEAWYLDLYRVPLVQGRTPAALVTDLALSTLRRADLPEEVQKSKQGEREYAELSLTLEDEKTASVLLACAQTAPDTAIMLVGRFETDAGEALRNTCRAIARSADVAPYKQIVDIAAAQANAKKALQDLAKDGLSPAWQPLRRTGRRFLHQSPAYTWAQEIQRYRPAREDDGLWWEVRGQTKVDLEALREIAERWLIKDDTSGHQYNSQAAGKGWTIAYMESRRPGSRDIRRELNASGSVRKITTTVDDTYACEPVLSLAAGKLAAPAIFNATESFPQAGVYWIMLPVGEASVPGKKGVKASAVLLQRDFDPDPVMLFYRNGGLVALSNDATTWQTLAGDEDAEAAE